MNTRSLQKKKKQQPKNFTCSESWHIHMHFVSPLLFPSAIAFKYEILKPLYSHTLLILVYLS